MKKGTTPPEYILSGPEGSTGLASVLVIPPQHAQGNPVFSRYDNTRRPNLYIQIDDFTARQWLSLTVDVVGAVFFRQLGIELSVRCSQPALADRRVRIELALKDDFFPVGGEHSKHEEDVGVFCGGGQKQLGRTGAGNFRLFLKRR